MDIDDKRRCEAPSTRRPPLRVAIVNDFLLVVAGLASVLEPFADRVVIAELDSQLPVAGEVDVVLYDPFGQCQGGGSDLQAVLCSAQDTPVMVFSWNTRPALVEAALSAGARGYVSKAVGAAALVLALERVASGQQVTLLADGPPTGDPLGDWPGVEQGLTLREAEVLALLCQGLSNHEIAERAFIGLNTVKTHLRVLFQKIGVDSRTRAALWGLDHGFRPDTVRIGPPPPHRMA